MTRRRDLVGRPLRRADWGLLLRGDVRRIVIVSVASVSLAAGLLREGPAAPPAEAPVLARIVIDGTINPAVSAFLDESVAQADADGAAALLVQLDTPGGLLVSTRAIVKRILTAPLPVIVYVAPSGAGAASAGVFITMAGHVAAMAPGTSIGAAHPVGGRGEDVGGTLGEKLESFTASFAEAIAEQRGRNVEWAVDAVRKSVSATAEEAAKLGVVDLVAPDVAALVRAVHGRTVTVGREKRPLAVLGPENALPAIRDYDMRLAHRLLDVIADPNVAYLLMMVGMIGLYVELTTPGLGVPGVAGVICLVLALMALHVLSVNYGALALLVLGIGLMVAEIFVTSFGLLGVGGLTAFLLGSLLLFDESKTDARVARELIVGATAAVAGTMLLVGGLAVRTIRRRSTVGAEGMVGSRGVTLEALGPGRDGAVRVHGERWRATCDEPLAAGDAVEVTAIEGLRLHVRRPADPRT
jgi:membrane-bound serine protease (ClpP class)